MPEAFRVEQALFGYREGHHLMAASVALEPRVRQFLANVTDGSGPEGSDGFETAFTGLPVPETNYYALFCTWPAPEMARPGCVWSHVLLINLADLARVPDLSILCELCVRPASPLVLSVYDQSLLQIESDGASRLERADDLARAEFLLTALYGQPESGIVILDEKGSPWEAIVFALWSQQWPRLRRNFSFSTGSLGDRRSGGVAFDLQVAPLGSQRLWGRSGLPTVMLEYSAKAANLKTSTWVSAALHDIYSGKEKQLRDFLFTYGSEVEIPRLAFVRLVECFIGPTPSEDDDPVVRLGQLATCFPEPTEALRLKRDQLTALTEGTNANDIKTSWAAIHFLLKAQEAFAFSRVSLNFGPHVALLWQRKRADVLALLGSLPENESSATFLQALASVLEPQDVPTLWYEQPSVLSRLLNLKPALATDPSAWGMPLVGQRALWDILRASTNDQPTWAFICGAMLQAQCSFAEQDSVALAGQSLADGILNWLKSNNFRLPSTAWRVALRTPLSSALRDGALPPALLALAVWALPADQARALPANRSDVQVLGKIGFSGVPEPLALHAYFWLVAVGFQTGGENGLLLLGRAFFPVYNAVAKSHYSSEAWEVLAPILPEVSLWLDWDRCRRLRLALRNWLRNNPRLSDAMIQFAPTNEYAQLVRSLS